MLRRPTLIDPSRDEAIRYMSLWMFCLMNEGGEEGRNAGRAAEAMGRTEASRFIHLENEGLIVLHWFALEMGWAAHYRARPRPDASTWPAARIRLMSDVEFFFTRIFLPYEERRSTIWRRGTGERDETRRGRGW